ncbi:cytochrome-c peroxidase [Nonlabens arenilitoris]|uniref:Cytochrome-c peroxidase n=1 Tax=Nonlabens arenilitoris TaxID=1217969 RepID=A0A2S7U6R7_9FLAO|nr:cytochrome c peroxidase [Nonlabens arenilitoris]PQJ30695.1 cytochrome-c peroxidase [Nonlabens arenilitoris]
MRIQFYFLLFIASITISCQNEKDDYIPTDQVILSNVFGSKIDLNNLDSYQNNDIPSYIRFSNQGNAIENDKATLGRILFYDTKLSTNNSISCASCHQQEHAFSDTAIASTGVNGMTGRHSMRLVNVGFQPSTNFFWNERVNSLENQVTQPIKDHAEMGFSGENGAPSFDDLLIKLSATDYYQVLFKHIYGDIAVTEERLQECLSQFVLSIQSFDSRYDDGLLATGNPGPGFPNYNMSENRGKFLFITTPENGGAGCVSCHVPPEFAIKNNIHNNGVIATIADPNVFDHDNTRSPSLRDLENPEGFINGPLMHNGTFTTLLEMVEHYNSIDMTNQQLLDPLLFDSIGPNGPIGQQLQLTDNDKTALINFLKTLTGTDIYTNPKWSDPFAD